MTANAGHILGILMSLGTVAAAPSAYAAGDPPGEAVFDGTWLYRKDRDDGISTAIQIQGSSMLYLAKEGNDIAFTRAWWTVNPYANPDDKGVYQVVTRMAEPAIDGAPQYEELTEELHVKMIDRDNGEVWLPGEEARRATLERIECRMAVSYVERSEHPPAGCQWAEVRGLGYDGLTGDCVWNEEWEENWDALSVDSEGNPSSMACLLSEPVSFPD
jgi:hypothetical protein